MCVRTRVCVCVCVCVRVCVSGGVVRAPGITPLLLLSSFGGAAWNPEVEGPLG